MSDLLADLRRGAAETARETSCPLCVYLASIDDDETQIALQEAAAGTIGINKLALILQKHDTGIGRRTIERHRREDHTL